MDDALHDALVERARAAHRAALADSAPYRAAIAALAGWDRRHNGPWACQVRVARSTGATQQWLGKILGPPEDPKPPPPELLAAVHAARRRAHRAQLPTVDDPGAMPAYRQAMRELETWDVENNGVAAARPRVAQALGMSASQVHQVLGAGTEHQLKPHPPELVAAVHAARRYMGEVHEEFHDLVRAVVAREEAMRRHMARTRAADMIGISPQLVSKIAGPPTPVEPATPPEWLVAAARTARRGRARWQATMNLVGWEAEFNGELGVQERVAARTGVTPQAVSATVKKARQAGVVADPAAWEAVPGEDGDAMPGQGGGSGVDVGADVGGGPDPPNS